MYGSQKLRFYPAPFVAPFRAFAVLVFPWRDESVLLCDIAGRGWCIPSGRVEPGETSFDAVVREAREEAGAVLKDIQYIGCYEIREKGDVRWADCFTSHVAELNEILAHEESRGIRFTPAGKLPKTYHIWNDLTEMVFEHSLKVLQRSGRL